MSYCIEQLLIIVSNPVKNNNEMRKATRIFIFIILFVTVPLLAGLGVEAIWNGIITDVCGFAAITYWQSVGLFLLGQLFSCGFVFPVMMLFGGMHALMHNRGDWHRHWHGMTDEQRREFIERRRDFFGHGNRFHDSANETDR